MDNVNFYLVTLLSFHSPMNYGSVRTVGPPFGEFLISIDLSNGIAFK